MENSCENCIHFARYYRKLGVKMKATIHGDCLRILKSKLEPCKYWEENVEITKEHMEQKIVKSLKEIENRLDYIAVLLDSD